MKNVKGHLVLSDRRGPGVFRSSCFIEMHVFVVPSTMVLKGHLSVNIHWAVLVNYASSIPNLKKNFTRRGETLSQKRGKEWTTGGDAPFEFALQFAVTSRTLTLSAQASLSFLPAKMDYILKKVKTELRNFWGYFTLSVSLLFFFLKWRVYVQRRVWFLILLFFFC